VAQAVVPLFRSDLQLRLLGLLVLHPDKTWTARDLAERLDATPVSVHRELHRALDSGLLTRESVGRTFLYHAATDSPLYEPVQLLLERTVGVEAELGRVLEEVPGVEAAFIHGSFARGSSVGPTSDIDVLVLGRADPHELRRRLREVEPRLGREIDVLAYTPDEFRQLVEQRNSLVHGIVRGPVKALVGTPEALDVG
jgi:predicted nucleotidyltransferase